jgi:hypothetical protein
LQAHTLRTKPALLIDRVEVTMADRGYVGKYRQRERMSVLAYCRRKLSTKISVTLAVVATVSAVGGYVETRATSWPEAVAPQPTAGHAARSSTAVRRPVEAANMTLGRLTVHFDATRPTVTTIAGDDVNRRLSWKVQINNRTGVSVTFGDPTAILWARDGSGHLAVNRQRIPPDSQQTVIVSFDLPKILEPSSITLTQGSTQAEVKVESPSRATDADIPRSIGGGGTRSWLIMRGSPGVLQANEPQVTRRNQHDRTGNVPRRREL